MEVSLLAKAKWWIGNKALGKIGWALASEEEKPWVKILKAKYFPALSFMKCKKKKKELLLDVEWNLVY